MDKPRSALELDQKGIDYRLVAHPNTAHTAADAAREIGLELGQIVKSLLAEGHRHPPVLLLVPGDRQVHFGRLGKILGDKSIFLCSPQRTLEVTGYPVGLVTPFGLKSRLDIMAETSVLAKGKVGVSSGSWGAEIVISVSDLISATGATAASFLKEKTPLQ